MASQIVSWIFALVGTLIVARYLGAANLGKLQLAVAIWAVMSIAIGFGMDTLLAKEVARDPDRTSSLFSSSLALRIGFFLVSLGLMAVYVQLAAYPAETAYVIYIVGLSTLILQISATCRAILQGHERMEFSSLSDVGTKAFITIAAVILVLRGYGLLPFAFLEVGGALVSLAIHAYAMGKVHRLRLHLDFQVIVWLLKASLPYLALSGILVVYRQVDTIIISLLVNDTQVGWYSAASRLTGTFLFIPSVLVTALLPALSRLHGASPTDAQRLMSRSFDLLLVVSVPMGLGLMAIANPLVKFLYGDDFANSGPILFAMAFMLVFTYQNSLLGQFFISSDRQKVWVAIMAVAAIATIPLDLLLIPFCQQVFGIGAMGGALSFLITESAMTCAGIAMLPQGALGWMNLSRGARVVAAGVAMSAVVWLVRDLFIVIPVTIGAVVYAACILVLRVVSKEDLTLFNAATSAFLARFNSARRLKPVGDDD